MAARRGMKPQWAALLLVAALALATCSRAAEFGGEGEAYDWEEDDYVSEAPSHKNCNPHGSQLAAR